MRNPTLLYALRITWLTFFTHTATLQKTKQVRRGCRSKKSVGSWQRGLDWPRLFDWLCKTAPWG